MFSFLRYWESRRNNEAYERANWLKYIYKMFSFFGSKSRRNNEEDERENLLNAVKKDPKFLKNRDQLVKNDPKLLLAAINSKCDFGYHLASNELQTDINFLSKAISQNLGIIYLINDNLKTNTQIICAGIKSCSSVFEMADKNSPDYRKIALFAMHEGRDPHVVFMTDESLCRDKEMIMAAINIGGSMIIYASNDLRADREVVLAAVRQQPYTIKYANVSLQKDIFFRIICFLMRFWPF